MREWKYPSYPSQLPNKLSSVRNFNHPKESLWYYLINFDYVQLSEFSISTEHRRRPTSELKKIGIVRGQNSHNDKVGFEFVGMTRKGSNRTVSGFGWYRNRQIASDENSVNYYLLLLKYQNQRSIITFRIRYIIFLLKIKITENTFNYQFSIIFII